MSTNNDWILMSERKPTVADLPVWTWHKEINGGQVIAYTSVLPGHPTHWKPVDIPAPPREKTQEDKDNDALLEWIGALGLPPTNVCVWEAALAYERAEVNKMLPDRPQIELGRGELVAVIEAIRARCGGGK